MPLKRTKEKEAKILGLSPRRYRRVTRSVESGHVVLYLGAITIGLAFVAALLVLWLTSETEFDTFGTAIWWAIVTLTTVGYGDVVPTSVLGRTAGAILMVFGVTFMAVLTAIITSVLVSVEQHRLDDARTEADDEASTDYVTQLQRIESRLDAIEQKLPD